MSQPAGLRSLADRQTGLREMHRVSRPGGRLLILDFGKPNHPAGRGICFAYLRACVPLLGWLVAGNAAAYAYIPESLQHYPAPGEMAAALRALPLVNVRTIHLPGGLMSIHTGQKPAAPVAGPA